MVDGPDNLLLVYLRRLDAKMDRVIDDLASLKDRVTALELTVGRMRSDLGSLAEADARLQVSFDRVDKRLERIERRLDLVEVPGHVG